MFESKWSFREVLDWIIAYDVWLAPLFLWVGGKMAKVYKKLNGVVTHSELKAVEVDLLAKIQNVHTVTDDKIAECHKRLSEKIAAMEQANEKFHDRMDQKVDRLIEHLIKE